MIGRGHHRGAGEGGDFRHRTGHRAKLTVPTGWLGYVTTTVFLKGRSKSINNLLYVFPIFAFLYTFLYP